MRVVLTRPALVLGDHGVLAVKLGLEPAFVKDIAALVATLDRTRLAERAATPAGRTLRIMLNSAVVSLVVGEDIFLTAAEKAARADCTPPPAPLLMRQFS